MDDTNEVFRKAFSVETFCKIYDVGRTTAFMEIRAGRLKSRKCGRRTLILAADAEAWASSLPSRSVTDEAA